MPSLNLAIARLVHAGTNNFAIWVVKAPYPSGHVIHDCVWTPNLTQLWLEWQQLFAGHSNLQISPQSSETPETSFPAIPSSYPTGTPSVNGAASPTGSYANAQAPIELPVAISGQPTNKSSQLMQNFGNSLWQWVFDGPILNSLEHNRGAAIALGKSLRLRLELRDPYLVAIPWEIMQRPGQPAISLSQNVIFSRTTSDVEPLPNLRSDPGLNVLLVLGEDENLELQTEAKVLKETLTQGVGIASSARGYAPCMVDTLIQPTPAELIAALETQSYNVLFYAGHGLRNPDGGMLNLHPEARLNGIELAQVLTRTGVKLAVFNSCWGAQPASVKHQAIPYSSLAEVLIRHGVPAVLGMRDEIRDDESISFIKAFSEALRSRKAIDEAVAEARQKLLTQFKFNYPAWTLPVLYMHPEFDGQILRSLDESITELPTSLPEYTKIPSASLRLLNSEDAISLLQTPITRIGRTTDNHIVIPDLSVSRQHAQIICRDNFSTTTPVLSYFLRDDSTGGTLIFKSGNWLRIHHQEVPLESGMQLKFGSSRNEIWEFIVEN